MEDRDFVIHGWLGCWVRIFSRSRRKMGLLSSLI